MDNLPNLPSGPDELRRGLERFLRRIPRELQEKVNALRSLGFSGLETYMEEEDIRWEAKSPSGYWKVKLLQENTVWDFICKGESAPDVMGKAVNHFAWAASMTPEEKITLRPILVKPIDQAELEITRRVIEDPDFDKEIAKYGCYQVE